MGESNSERNMFNIYGTQFSGYNSGKLLYEPHQRLCNLFSYMLYTYIFYRIYFIKECSTFSTDIS